MNRAKQQQADCQAIAQVRQTQFHLAQQDMVQAQQAMTLRQSACDDLEQNIGAAQKSWRHLTTGRIFDPNMALHWGHHILSLQVQQLELAQARQAASEALDCQRLVVSRADAALQAAHTLEKNASKMSQRQHSAQLEMQSEDRATGYFASQDQTS